MAMRIYANSTSIQAATWKSKKKTDAGFAEKGKKLETAFFAVATSFYWWAHAHHPSTLTPVLAKTLSILFDKCPH